MTSNVSRHLWNLKEYHMHNIQKTPVPKPGHNDEDMKREVLARESPMLERLDKANSRICG